MANNPKNTEDADSIFSIAEAEWSGEVPNLTRLLDRTGGTSSPKPTQPEAPKIKPLPREESSELSIELSPETEYAPPPPIQKSAARKQVSLESLGVLVQHYFILKDQKFLYDRTIPRNGQWAAWQGQILDRMELDWKALQASAPFHEFHVSDTVINATFGCEKPSFIQIIRTPETAEEVIVLQSEQSLSASKNELLALFAGQTESPPKKGPAPTLTEDDGSISIELDLAS